MGKGCRRAVSIGSPKLTVAAAAGLVLPHGPRNDRDVRPYEAFADRRGRGFWCGRGAAPTSRARPCVDRSIDGPADFVQTNVVGTFVLLEAARRHFAGMSADRKAAFRFHHVSTDEVFGALEHDDPPFTEDTPYDPRSPYSATKAASDHLVRA